MTEDRYKRLMETLGTKEVFVSLINAADWIITVAVFLGYVAGIIYLFFTGSALVLPMILIPAIPFVLVSVFRRLCDSKRPYEVYDTPPILKKDTRGKSFPSRHVFSIFIIGVSFYYLWPVVGTVILILGVIQAVIRVTGGVHFIRDVIAGALFGAISGLVGFYLILPI